MALPNIEYDTIGDLATAEVLSGEWLQLRADNGALPNHPALMYVGSIAGRGSNVIKVRHVGLNGHDPMAAAGDGSAVPATAIIDGSTLVVVTRQSLARKRTDLAGMVSPDLLGIPRLAMDAMQSYATRMTNMICDVIDGFTATAGSSGVDLTLSDILAAQGTARGLGAAGPWMGVLHTQQWSDFVLDAGLNAGGAIQWQPATAEMLQLRTSAYQGTFLGTDWFVSSRVVTANSGANRAGALFARGAVLWGDGDYPPPRDPNNQVVIGGKICVDIGREGESGQDKITQHAMLGVSKGLEFGVSIITDA